MTSRYRPTPDVATAMRSAGAVLAIDPGPTRSAWLFLEDDEIIDFGLCDNEQLLSILRGNDRVYVGRHPHDTRHVGTAGAIVIEKVESFGMAVGAEVFETVFWSGRFAEAADPLPVERIGRKAVKIHLCGSMRAKDPNIRQALIDRFGGPEAIGRKASPGPLYGVAGDVWSALAVAVTWADIPRETRGAA